MPGGGGGGSKVMLNAGHKLVARSLGGTNQ